ncbi:MAG: hypothetical protein WCK84_07595 [Bacteroidota bacterium]
MEQHFTEKESLELIGKMINSAKNNLQKGLGNIFLLWGYLVASISLVIFILLIVLPGETKYYSFFLWSLMAIGAPFHIRLIKKMEQQQLVKTYIDKIMDFVWIAFTISIVTFIAGTLITTMLVLPSFTEVEQGFEFLRWFPWTFVTPFMLCLYGFALFVSGKAYQFKPLVTGGIICWVATLVLLVSFHHPHLLKIQEMVLFISVIFGFIIPGHLLRKKENSHV